MSYSLSEEKRVTGMDGVAHTYEHLLLGVVPELFNKLLEALHLQRIKVPLQNVPVDLLDICDLLGVFLIIFDALEDLLDD
jgi:hypothetical protein